MVSTPEGLQSLMGPYLLTVCSLSTAASAARLPATAINMAMVACAELSVLV